MTSARKTYQNTNEIMNAANIHVNYGNEWKSRRHTCRTNTLLNIH